MPKILITASGGGHTGYAIAVGEALQDKGHTPWIIVDPNDTWTIEKVKKTLPGSPMIPLKRLRGPNEPLARLILRAPSRIPEIASLARYIRHGDILICTGSNHSLLAAIAGKLRRATVLCIEAIDRITTRSRTPAILHDYLNTPILLHWEEQLKNYPKGILVGPIYEKPRHKPWNEEYILVITGSMGNPRLVKLLLKTTLENVVIQTGRTIEPAQITDRKRGWRAFKYTPDIGKWIAGAKLVIAHQGLSIVEAALAYKKPVLLAFNPDLPLTSTLEDAEKLAEILNTRIVNPTYTTPRELEEAIEETINNYTINTRTYKDYYNAIIKIINKAIGEQK